MIRVMVSYPNTPGARFDMDYYLNRHLPLVAGLVPAMKGWAVDQGLAGGAPGSPAEFMIQAHLVFENVEAFETAMASVGPRIMADIANYTDIQPHIQINKVLSEGGAQSAAA